MTDEKPRVIIIPPKPELQQTAAVTKQLRVAAYCRVSTKEEEQASSYEAQCEYYSMETVGAAMSSVSSARLMIPSAKPSSTALFASIQVSASMR